MIRTAASEAADDLVRNQMDVDWIEVEADTTLETVADAVEVAWARMGAVEFNVDNNQTRRKSRCC